MSFQSNTEQPSTVSSQAPVVLASSGYTPGPWIARGAVTPVGGTPDMLWVGEINPSGEFRGAIARVQSADHVRGCITREEAAANARLIAALPDLVEALQEAREFIDGQVDVVDGSYGEPSPNRAMSLAQLIDDVLAKAGA